MNDAKLLRQYVQEGSRGAFDTLVERYLRLVYSVCYRMLGGEDRQLAEDATQVVFLILAEKARSLPKKVVLSGWLFQTARFASLDLRKREARRRHYEQHAAKEHAEMEQGPHAEWRDVEPLIDDMLARLRPLDRQAVLLRFYEAREFDEVAGMLGVSEQAARMRVSRAVAKLRGWLSKEGVAVSAAVLLTWLSSEMLSQPPLMAADIALRALDTSVAGSNLILCSKGVIKTMLIMKLKTAATVAAALLLTGTGAVKLAALAGTRSGTPGPIARPVATPPSAQKPASQRIIKRIVFTANTPDRMPSIPADTLKGMMESKEGKLLDSDALNRDFDLLFNRTTGYSRKQGYLVDVNPNVNVDPATGVLTISLIEAHVQTITITGNKTVPTESILRFLHLKPGDVFNEKTIQNDLTKVYETGLFTQVGPFEEIQTDSGQLKLKIPVVEKGN